MEENVDHQDGSFQSQTQSEPQLSSTEAENVPTGVQTLPMESQSFPAPPRPRRFPLIKTLVIVLLVLIVLLTGTGIYAMERPSIPGGNATIRITPDSQLLSKTYTINTAPDSTDSTLNPIGVRTISITTPAKSLTVPATGKQQVPATYASGVLIVGNGDAAHPVPFGEYSIYSHSGVAIVFHINSTIPGGRSAVVSAQAMNPGPNGNIAKFDVDARYFFPNADLFLLNQQPFSGGHNGYTTAAVSQNDIDSATSQLTNQLQSELPADQSELKSQLASSEQLLDPTHIRCQPSVKANRHPNDQASNVTVTGSMTCSSMAYTPAKLQTYGANLLKKDAYTQWGGSYALIGQIQEKLHGALNLGNTSVLTLDVQGFYAFQLNPGVTAHFASLVAGQTQAHAQAILLQQAGVARVSLQVSGGFGTALPSSPKDIHITIPSGQE